MTEKNVRSSGSGGGAAGFSGRKVGLIVAVTVGKRGGLRGAPDSVEFGEMLPVAGGIGGSVQPEPGGKLLYVEW